MSIILGIIGLGFIVFIHELGHFLIAKKCGVFVESFSIGMGPVLLHKEFHDTDCRLSLIPLGGYCGMKGQKDFQLALEENQDSIRGDKDSFYGVSPLKRALIAFAGPLSNFIFAIIAFTIISMIGYSYYSSENKIILASDIYPQMHSIAKESGLLTGDKIISIDSNPTPYFNDIYEDISLSPQKELVVKVLRNNQELEFSVTPELNKETGAGVIGIISWTDPIIESVEKDTPADIVGLKSGDIILSIDDIPVKNTAEYKQLISNKEYFSLKVLRDNKEIYIPEIQPTKTENSVSLGIIFKSIKLKSKTYSFFPAIYQGTKETIRYFVLSLKSIGLLFKGVDISKAVSGPLRITVMLGDTAKQGFSAGFSIGVVSILNLLALISLSLFIMNLLPIPILDGGLILFAIIEFFIKKPISPKIQYYVQFIGIAFILILFVIAMFGDISYLRNLFTHK